MAIKTAPLTAKVLRGRVLTFFERPAHINDTGSYAYWEDGAVAISGETIAWRGQFSDLPDAYRSYPVINHQPGLIMAGFIDTHTHFVQMGVIASYGAQLMDWLEKYTFMEEAKFAERAHAEAIADRYLDELVLNGVTTAAVFGSSHKSSMDAFFTKARARNFCMVAGKCLMDRHAPETLRDTPQSGYDDSKALIDEWHGNGRLHYAVTPRFAITCTEAQLELAGTLLNETQGAYLQTHLSENRKEMEDTAALFPNSRDYLDVYETFGLLGPRSLFGHCIHLEPRERSALRESQSVAVFCPTSNMFLGSGLFDYNGLQSENIRIALATDIGGGTSYSMLTTASEAYKICQLQDFSLNPLESFYLLTLGNARALSLEERIGTIEAGSDADLIVLDVHTTSAMRVRMETAGSLSDELFILQMLGDDRSIAATYVAGEQLK